MLENIKRLCIQVTVFLFLSLFCFQQVLAIGVSPSIIEMQDLSNNIVIDKVVFLSRANPSQSEYYKISVEGPAAAAIVLSTNSITLPKGEKQVPFKFQVKPVGLPNGDYKVFLLFSGSTAEGEASSGQNNVAFLTGVTAQISFTISGKEIKNFEIVEVYPDQTEVDQPFIFSFLLKNMGNVDLRPDRIELIFTDRTDPTHVIRENIEKDMIPAVGPQKTEKVSIKIKSKLPEGKYDLLVNFYSNDLIIFTKTFLQDILPKGSLSQKIDFAEFKTNKDKYGVGETVYFTGVAKNSGEIATESIFVIQVTKNGQPLDIKRSDKQLLLKSETVDFPLSFVPDEKGTYHVKAYFEFGNQKSESKELDFVVASDDTLMYVIGAAVFFILIVILIILIIKRNKKRGIGQPPSAPQAPIAPAPSVQPPVASAASIPPQSSPEVAVVPTVQPVQPVAAPSNIPPVDVPKV